MIDLDEAVDFAVKKHRGQRRNGTAVIPYVTHLFDVMKRVSSYDLWRGDDKLLLDEREMYVAALWHDLLEDCQCTREEILERSNDRVLQVVEECTRPRECRRDFLSRHIWLGSFSEKSLASVVVKVADRVCNVSDYISMGKSAYASKYAVQAYPVFWSYQLNGKNAKVFDDLTFLNRIGMMRYSVNMFDFEHAGETVLNICSVSPQQD